MNLVSKFASFIHPPGFHRAACAGLLFTIICPAWLPAQIREREGTVAELFKQHCAACHGTRGEGGLGSSLIDGTWQHSKTDGERTRAIMEGLPGLDMPGFGEVLSPKEVHSLVVYMHELAAYASDEQRLSSSSDQIHKSKHHRFRLEEVTRLNDGTFWSVHFATDDTMLLSGFNGGLYLCDRDGKLEGPVRGTPAVWRHGQGGMLDIIAHPDYAQNGWIYLSFSESLSSKKSDSKKGSTRIVRGRIKNGKWVDEQDIFSIPEDLHSGSGVHFGCRMVCKDGYLYFTVGERGRMTNAQDLSNPHGKVHRLHDDGRVPEDNPFLDHEGAWPSIWTYGNRNPQGLTLHPENGGLWESEHGPRGGDELNLVQRGKNYGWPLISYGINYNGEPITDKTAAPGMEQPVHHWTPSIAVCGIDFLSGSAFPKWQNHLFVSGLASRQLQRLEIDAGGRIADREILLQGLGRIRDVCGGPDGLLYIIVNQGRSGPGILYRLLPSPASDP